MNRKIAHFLILSLIISLPILSNASINILNQPDIKLGNTNSFVKQLQTLLNANGFIINNKSGQPGSQGFETTYFGEKTKQAIINFQNKYNIKPANGYVGIKTKTKIQQLLSGKQWIEISKGKPVAYGEQLCSSITHYSITWTFDKSYPCGSFANGEPWVVGPIKITAITPNNNTTWNETDSNDPGPNSGSMKLTVSNIYQGYLTKNKYTLGMPTDSNGKPIGTIYDKSLDVSRNLPATLQSGEMLMTARGQVEVGDVRSAINEIAVLTALDSIPPEGSFRPGLFSTGPRVVKYNKSQINYGVLKNLPAVAATPSQAYVESFMPALPWFEFDNSWGQSSFGPANNFATDGKGISYPNASSVYGREIATKWGIVSLWLNTNNPQSVKEKTMIQTIQSGIDIASFLENGGMFYADGGHKLGRKFPVLLAGLALNDNRILSLASSNSPLYFSEDQSTFIVCGEQDTIYCPPGHTNDVGRIVSSGAAAQYLPEDVGLADWGVKHTSQPQYDDRRWWIDNNGGVPYRGTWSASLGSVLAAEIMGQKNTWNHLPTFFYNERFFERVGGVGDNFVGQMWDAYKPYDSLRVEPVTISPNGGKLSSAKQVALTSATAGAQIRYTTDGTTPNMYSNLYTGPITVSTTQTIRAIAYKDGMRASAVSSANFTFDVAADWTIHYVDSQEPSGGVATQAFDNYSGTTWHTEWRNYVSNYPHEIQINLGKLQTLDGFSYLPRQDNETNGDIADYEFYVSTDGTNWGSPVSKGKFTTGKQAKIMNFPSVNAQYIRLRGLSSINGNPYAGAAEIGVSISNSTTATTTPPITTTPTTFTLTTSSTNGTITKSPDQPSYTSRTSVTLTATANAGYQFSSWTGCTSSTNTCTVTMDQDKTVVANFTQITVPTTYTLTASKTGTGTGSIIGISQSVTTLNQGDSITLTAQANTGSKFTGWGGDCSGTSSCVISNIQSNKVISANFDLIPTTITPTTYVFNVDLKFGMTHPDVKFLQKFLNNRGYTVAKSGSGSLGNETEYFGKSTQKALIKYQTIKAISPASGYFGPATREVVNNELLNSSI